MSISKRKTNNQGFFTLTMVLLVSVAVLAVVTGMILRSITAINQSVDSEMSLKAWSTVNACGEHALLQMSTTSDGMPGWSYASTTGESLSVGSSTCYIYPVETSGTDKLIRASSTVSGYTKKIVIDVATNTPSLLVNSWEEVADF
jgi:hypothetical protein